MSKLSIIVATYRMQREAPRTIRSLLPPLQRCVDDLDYEIIVVDNGSPELLDLGDAVRRPPDRYVSFGSRRRMRPRLPSPASMRPSAPTRTASG